MSYKIKGKITEDGRIEFSQSDLWHTFESQVIDLINNKTIEYLSKQSIKWHIQDGMDTVFGEIEKLVKENNGEDADLLEVGCEGFVNAIYIVVQLVLEEVLPEIHLKPEWKTNKLWSEIVKAKKENNND